jgi:hypothetical protein
MQHSLPAKKKRRGRPGWHFVHRDKSTTAKKRKQVNGKFETIKLRRQRGSAPVGTEAEGRTREVRACGESEKATTKTTTNWQLFGGTNEHASIIAIF